MRPTLEEYVAAFPRHLYPTVKRVQHELFEILGRVRRTIIAEIPTGSGKTAIGYTFLKAHEQRGAKPLFYITPNKAQVEQIKRFHPDVRVAYGRSEHPCLYYPGEELRANETPCLLLTDCPHRVNQETGVTLEPGVTPCPYYQQKFEAKQGGIVVSTMAFYLFTQMFSQEWDRPEALVIDEAHRLPQVVRSCLSYDITDWQLGRAVELLSEIDSATSRQLDRFLKAMIRIIRSKRAGAPTLLEEEEIEELMSYLDEIDVRTMRQNIGQAIRKRQIDPHERREVLTKIDDITHNLRRYRNSLKYSLPKTHHGSKEKTALNYTFAYYVAEKGERDRVQYRLVIKSYFVAPLIERILSDFTLAMSATIGDPKIFGYESGLSHRSVPFYPLGEGFPAKNTRVFMPIDTPDLAQNARRRNDLNRTLRLILRATKRFAKHDLRSLVIVVSNAEREKLVEFAAEEGVDAVSYGNGISAREAARRFRDGEASVLIGTVAHFGEGIDLPREIAPVIFFLRPGYPRPDDPQTEFEDRRFGGGRWGLWNWRVSIEALQARGRNIRSVEDRGVTFFVSQQFRRVLRGSLPQWLQPAYRHDRTFNQCVDETLQLLGKN